MYAAEGSICLSLTHYLPHRLLVMQNPQHTNSVDSIATFAASLATTKMKSELAYVLYFPKLHSWKPEELPLPRKYIY